MLRTVGYSLLAAGAVALLIMLYSAASGFEMGFYYIGFLGPRTLSMAVVGQRVLFLFEPLRDGQYQAIEGYSYFVNVTLTIPASALVNGTVTLPLDRRVVVPPPPPFNVSHKPIPVAELERVKLVDLACYIYDGRVYDTKVKPLVEIAWRIPSGYERLKEVFASAQLVVPLSAANPRALPLEYTAEFKLELDRVVLCVIELDLAGSSLLLSNGTRVPVEELDSMMFEMLLRGVSTAVAGDFTTRVRIHFRATPLQVARAAALLLAGAVLVALDAVLTGISPFLFLRARLRKLTGLRRLTGRRGSEQLGEE